MGTPISWDLYARDHASGTFTKVGRTAEGAATRTDRLGRALRRGALATAVMAGAAGVFIAKVGSQYVGSLNKIQTLTDSSDATMRRAASTLERNSLQYARMGMTTGDAASGVVELTKAGLTLDASMKAVSGTMVLAKAGEMGVAEASTLVSNTLNTFGLKAERAADVANYLANAANISSADVVDLAEAFKYVAPVAAASGVKVETVNAMLAELANKGINASVAGTGLRNMFTSLQSPAGRGGKAIKQLGVDVFDAQGKARPFKTVLGELGTALSRVDDQKKKAALKDIFGKEGLTSAQILLDGGVKSLNEYEKGVVKAGGAQRFAQSASKGLAGTWQILKASGTSMAQSVYRNVEPLADGVLRPLAMSFADLSTKAGPAVGSFVSKLKSAFSGGGGGGELAKTGASVAAFGRSLAPILSDIGSRLRSTLGPGLRQIGQLVTTQLLPAFRTILPVVAPVARFLLRTFGTALVGTISGAIQMIKGAIQTLSGVMNIIGHLFTGQWGKLWGDVKQIAGGAMNMIVGAVRTWWYSGILSVFRGAATFLTQGLWRNLWTALRSGASGGMRSIGSAISAGVSGVGRLLLAGVRSYARIWINGWRVLRSAFGGIVASIRSVASQLVGAVRGALSRAMSAGVSAVRSGAGRVVGAIRGLPGKIKGALGNAGGLLVNAGKAIIQGLIDGISSKISALTGKLKSITSLIPKNKGPKKVDAKLLRPTGQIIMDGLIAGFRDREGQLTKMLQSVTRRVKSIVSRIEGLRRERADFARGFQWGTSVFSTQAEDGMPLTVRGLLSKQRGEARQSSRVNADVRRLLSMGLSRSLIRQMQAGGAGGIDALQALAKGTRADIREFNRLNATTERNYSRAGYAAADKLGYGKQIREQQDELRFARALERALQRHQQKVVIEIDGREVVGAIIRYERKTGKK